MGIYLCYDVRGIQAFIFQIPQLKYIVGGSALVDQFDRETIPGIQVTGVERIFSAGGRGAFRCDSDSVADQLQNHILKEAHALGLSVRFGRNRNFQKASFAADQLFSFIPDSLEGTPCPESAIYPVKPGAVHPVVDRRKRERGYFEKRFIKGTVLISESAEEKSFFHNVHSTDGMDGRNGARTLGDRNRWAIICMDGNDMGLQFRAMADQTDEKELIQWIRTMSTVLDKCTNEAVSLGIQRVVSLWNDPASGNRRDTNGVLPIRPLVAGGDDVIVLCHVSYAMAFVKEVMRVFEERSSKAHQDHLGKTGTPLWPATGGRLTISAGVLYCPVTLPLHSAIPYAEMLLASAKSAGRSRKGDQQNVPAPASLDWEQLTDSVIDTPVARRMRDFRFHDPEQNRVIQLTCRPYTLEEFSEVENLSLRFRKIPATIRHGVLRELRQSYSARIAYEARIAKEYSNSMYSYLCEYPNLEKSRWKLEAGSNGNPDVQKTDVVDALLLLEEQDRMGKEISR